MVFEKMTTVFPTLVGMNRNIKAICDRSMSVYNGHASSAEQPNYFDALTLRRAA